MGEGMALVERASQRPPAWAVQGPVAVPFEEVPADHDRDDDRDLDGGERCAQAGACRDDHRKAEAQDAGAMSWAAVGCRHRRPEAFPERLTAGRSAGAIVDLHGWQPSASCGWGVVEASTSSGRGAVLAGACGSAHTIRRSGRGTASAGRRSRSMDSESMSIIGASPTASCATMRPTAAACCTP